MAQAERNREPREDGDAAAHILIVDDEAFIRNAFQLYFESIGYLVSVAEGGETALSIFDKAAEPVDVVLLDLVMPGIPGIELLQKLKERDETVEVIIATGCGSMNSAIEALRYGAYDYITKPILNFDEDLLRVIRGAITTRLGRLAQKKETESGERSSSGTVLALEFYRALETLARQLAPDWESARATTGRFLEKELGVIAAVALAERDGEVACLARWGAADAVDEVSLAAESGMWLQEIEVHRGWKLLRPGDRAFALYDRPADGPPLEALRIPMTPSGPGIQSPTSDILLFRPKGCAAAHAPPDVGLLGIVLAQALARLAI